MSGELVLHVNSNLKSYVESKNIKKFLDFLKEDEFDQNEFFKPKTFKLSFDLIESKDPSPLDKFFDPKIIKFSSEVSIFKLVKIISALYNIKDISCSKDGKHLYYKNMEFDNFEFSRQNEFSFVVRKEVGEFEDFIDKYDSLKFRTQDGAILVKLPNSDDECVFLNNYLCLVKEYELSPKYSNMIKSITKGRKLQMIVSKYSDSRDVLSKSITESLDMLEDYEITDEDKPASEICDLEVIISTDSLTGAYSRDIYLVDFADFLNKMTKCNDFSVSPDNKHLYYKNKEVIDKISSTFRTLITKFELSKEDAEEFRKLHSIRNVAYKVLKYAFKHCIDGFSMDSAGILSYQGINKLSIGINDDNELEVFEEHELNINTETLSFYLNRA